MTMKSSPYASSFTVRIATWEATLTHLLSLTEEWLKVQSTWQYLQPIFGSEDIVKQMPSESKKFDTVDRYGRADHSPTL